MKFIIWSNTIDIWTRLEILLEFKLSGKTNTLPEASNLLDDIYKSGETQNEQEYPNAADNFNSS